MYVVVTCTCSEYYIILPMYCHWIEVGFNLSKLHIMLAGANFDCESANTILLEEMQDQKYVRMYIGLERQCSLQST